MSTPLIGSDLKYVPLCSLVDTTFWHVLSQKKLNDLKLDESPFSLTASFRNDQAPGLPPLVSFDYESFGTKREPSVNVYPVFGDVIVTNTLEAFKSMDVKSLLDKEGHRISKDGDDSSQSLQKKLSRFFLITYLDLKKFKFYFWFAFPSLKGPKATFASDPQVISKVFTPDQISSLEMKHKSLDANHSSYFLVVLNSHHEVSLHSIEEYPHLKDSIDLSNIYLSFSDPSSHSEYPGWPLRNLLSYVQKIFKAENNWNILCYRVKGRNPDVSLCFKIRIEETSDSNTCVGWEKNEKDKLVPRVVDLSHILDPVKLSENAVNLNLKLMRWRLVPELDLEKISELKVLILGAGTLGCNVARALLGWGVKNITLVDNSRVSYSNPVRQSLFHFEDCLMSGKQKAQAASDELKRIYPKVNSRGIELSIPMPGHPVTDSNVESTEKAVQELEKLVTEHDCMFLLMDTRESRWLPTLLAQKHKKLVINAALGFDTYLVQRHGINQLIEDQTEVPSTSSPLDESSSMRRKLIPGNQLGCYFCNDVVAPGNSTRDRTLDQQCTVTRPGVSMIAAALAVELLVSVVQHPLGSDAPSQTTCGDAEDGTESCLGIVPHQIRGFLSQFHEVLPSTAAFKYCTGCSAPVIRAYLTEGFEFLRKAFNDPLFLEEMTGLKKLHEESDLQDVWALSDEDDDASTLSGHMD